MEVSPARADDAELSPLERREQIIGRLLLAYHAVLQDGRYDIAFNTLSRHLYDLRDAQHELEQSEQGQEEELAS